MLVARVFATSSAAHRKAVFTGASSRYTQLSEPSRDQQEKITEVVATNVPSATRLSAPG
jgi:hypothetical protein